MALVECRCGDCGRRVIIDERDLEPEEDELLCPYCGAAIEVAEND